MLHLRRSLSTAARRADVCVVAAVRTPIGGFNGSLAAKTAPELGAVAITGALAKAGLDPSAVQQCWMGNVLSAGMGQAPAQAQAHWLRRARNAPVKHAPSNMFEGASSSRWPWVQCTARHENFSDEIQSGGEHCTPASVPRDELGAES